MVASACVKLQVWTMNYVVVSLSFMVLAKLIICFIFIWNIIFMSLIFISSLATPQVQNNNSKTMFLSFLQANK